MALKGSSILFCVVGKRDKEVKKMNNTCFDRPSFSLLAQSIDDCVVNISKEVVYRNNIKTFVLRPPQRSLLHQYFQKEEIPFAYAGAKNAWYPASLLVLNAHKSTLVYHSVIPNQTNLPEYTSSEDRFGRKYLLAPVNRGGYVPVHHGTDPVLSNWLALDSRIKIVYDSNSIRHPAMEGIDYAAHGFKLLNERIWWPLLNGKFKPIFKRIKEPYFEGYNHLFVPEKDDAASLGRYIVGLGFVAGNLPGGALAQQIVRPEVDHEMLQNGRAQERRRVEVQLQRPILEALHQQDSFDFSEEIAQLLQSRGCFEKINSLFQENRDLQMLAEHRGKLVKQTVIFEATKELELILESGPISQEDRGQALLDSVERVNLAIIRILLSGNPFIPPEQYGQSVVRAAQLGATEILRFLLEKRVLPEAMGQAAIEAVERGAEGDLDLLLQSGPVAIEKRGLAAISACRQILVILQKVLVTGPILQTHRGEATIESVKQGNWEHMRVLISAPISPEHRGKAAIEAAKNRKPQIVKELSGAGPLPLTDKILIAGILGS
ncbi:MAG: hypothetical protein KGJ02_07125 [Verrucomicrobiota bacterium]|nr:hypothetical protein [Verrucomicrobiota bacterium]